MDITRTIESLKNRGFAVSYFETGAEAADYVCAQVKDSTAAFGGSKTLETLGLFDKLAKNNTVYWHWVEAGRETLIKALTADYFFSSANAISADGQILNIDGRGNRVAATLFGHKKVFIIAGTNKICPDYDSALYRARNVAAVTNAGRFDVKTPCKLDGKCHDCRAKDRICSALTVLWAPMMDMETEVILINETLGY